MPKATSVPASKSTTNSLALYSSPHSESAEEKPMTTCFHLITTRNETFSPTQILRAKQNQSNPSLTATCTPTTRKKRKDWRGKRTAFSVLDLGELLERPDWLRGSADVAVGFAERAVQVLLETGRLLPHRQPLLVEGAGDLLVLRQAHLVLHRRRRRHPRESGAPDGEGSWIGG